MTSILELRDVVRVHGSGETAVHALRGVSLGVGPGELVAVMGPSGSGKSTLLNVAGGLDAPTSGSVLVEGTALGGRSRSAGTPPGRGRRRRRNRFTISGMSLLTIVQRLGHRPWFATFSRTCLVPIDRLIARLSRGRIVTAGLLPALMLTTVGRRSGLPRTQPLVCIPDGDGFLLIGSNWGQPHHPAWSANLIAHPEARVVWRGEEFGVRAELATGPERDRLWALALRTWPAYETYQKRAAHRQIRVFRLTRI